VSEKSDIKLWARGKRGGFSPGAAARHRGRTTGHAKCQLILPLCFPLFFEIGHLPDLRSHINRSQIGHLEKESSDVLKIETSLSDLKSEVSLFDVSFFRRPISDRTSISDAFFRCPI